MFRSNKIGKLIKSLLDKCEFEEGSKEGGCIQAYQQNFQDITKETLLNCIREQDSPGLLGMDEQKSQNVICWEINAERQSVEF